MATGEPLPERGDMANGEQDQAAADLAALDVALKASDDGPELPNLEKFGPLKAARENAARIDADIAAAKASRRELADSLGIKAKIDAANLEKIAAELIASGKPADAVEKLEAATRAVRRLEAARVVAEERIGLAYVEAVAAAEPAVAAYLAPADREVAIAHVQLCRAESKRAARVAELRAAGHLRHTPASLPRAYSGDAYAMRSHFAELIMRGVLTDRDVAGLID